jgi:hypothetical protein
MSVPFVQEKPGRMASPWPLCSNKRQRSEYALSISNTKRCLLFNIMSFGIKNRFRQLHYSNVPYSFPVLFSLQRSDDLDHGVLHFPFAKSFWKKALGVPRTDNEKTHLNLLKEIELKKNFFGTRPVLRQAHASS